MIHKLKPKSEFSKNTISLISGNVLSQSIPAALSPILTRIYSPEDFGLFAVFSSFAAIFFVIGTFKYDMAILIPKSDKEAINILFLVAIISFLISILSFFIIFFFKDSISSILGIEDIANWLYAIPISVIFVGIYNALIMWSTRKKRFKRISLNMVVSSAFGTGSNVSFGLLGFGSIGFLYGMLIGQFASFIHIFIKTIKNESYLFKYVNLFTIKRIFFKFKKMPLFVMSNTLIDMVRIASLNFLVINFFSSSVLGQMTLAFRIIRTPMTLIGGSIIQVFLQKLSITKKEDTFDLLLRYLIKFSLFSLPFYIFLFFFSPVVFPFLFGERWVLAGNIGSILSVWMFFHVLTVSSGHIMILHKKEEVMLYFSLIYLVVPFAVFFFLDDLPFLNVFLTMSFIMALINIIFILYSLFFTYSLKHKHI